METQICSKCNEEKSLTNEFFNFRTRSKTKFRSDCKVCQNLKQSECYKNKKSHYYDSHKIYRADLLKVNQILMWDFLLKNPCVVCGETNPVVLEFDHLRDKKYCISEILFSHKWESVQKEMAKCQVLCSNCHKKKTAKDFKHYRYIEDIEKFL